jgi:hypothetical protein
MHAEASEPGSRKWLKGEPAGLDKKVKYHKGMRRVKPIISGNASDDFCLDPPVVVAECQSGKPGIAGAFVPYQWGICITT